MKEVVNLREFRQYCENNKPKRIIFHTEDQYWYSTSLTYKIELSFEIILIHENPNLVCLKSDNGTILFNRIKSVEIDTSLSGCGTIFRLFCEDPKHKKQDIVYNLLSIWKFCPIMI